ncbi:MAG: hypothetical protein ACR2N1_05560 [Rubripirellula sp.]
MSSPQLNPELDSKENNPYQTPLTEKHGKPSLNWPVPLVIAICIWPLLSFKIFFSGMMLKTWAEEFDIRLSTLSLVLIHPMMPLFILTATFFILFSAFSLKKPSQRRKLGHIACVLGLLVLATAILGLIVPMVQLALNLM